MTQNFDPTKTPGTFAAPPDYAPHEVTSGEVTPTADQIDTAARNERSLKPLVFEKTGPLTENVPKQPIVVRQGKPPVLPERERTPQPAASDTDSPSRGMPRASTDPGKTVTGGFGVAGPPQYFPLDGAELREAVLGLFGELEHRLKNDLRFHPAITYPRVAIKVTVLVTGYTGDTDFAIEKTKEHADLSEKDAETLALPPVKIEVEETLREFGTDGAAENPPDRIRESLGLSKPRKQTVMTPTGRQIVDQPTNLLNSF